MPVFQLDRLSNMRGRNAVSRASVVVAALSVASAVAQSTVSLPTPAPAELVRTAVNNEVVATNDTSVKHLFRSRKQYPRGSQTKLYVETREALAGMVIAYNDQPLNAPQLQGEIAHLEGLRGDPEQLRKKQAREKEDAERTLRIVKALPDAFVYEYDGAEQSTKELGKEGDALLRLKFRPNPHYEPPSRVEQVLTGMQGYVLIDAATRRVARIDGTLFKDVSFGWGILGHLDKGGHFLVQQSDVGDGTWTITQMSLSFTGKILLFKSISITSEEVFSDFRRVPADTTFTQGVDLLKAEQAKIARSLLAAPSAERTAH